jgi:hypothetical protein
MNHNNILKKLFWLFSLLLFFTNCKNDAPPKGHLKMKQSSFTISANDKKTIEYYRNDINNAVSLLVSQKNTIDLELNKNEKIEILAIGFPEMLRYNAFNDLIETSSNRLLYINAGSTAADFSTGFFQMKPSFVEDLEKYVAEAGQLGKYKNILIENKTEKATRVERINRLEDFRWQLRYLKVIWMVMEEKYSYMLFKNKKDKLRFYATAYNFGFLQPEKMITNYQKIKAFPYGKDKKNALRFADFSIDFSNNYNSLFNQ